MADLLCRSRVLRDSWECIASGGRRSQAVAKRIARTRERREWQQRESAAEID